MLSPVRDDVTLANELNNQVLALDMYDVKKVLTVLAEVFMNIFSLYKVLIPKGAFTPILISLVCLLFSLGSHCTQNTRHAGFTSCIWVSS